MAETDPFVDANATLQPQLTQARVPLEEAGDALISRDATGRIPIVVIPQRLSRINTRLLVIAAIVLAVGIFVTARNGGALAAGLAVPLAVALVVLSVYQSFIVRVPEGANALLLRGGRYYKTLPSGTHLVPPYIFVSHLVTRREIPFDVPALNTPTKDDVFATVDTLVIFAITDPYRFVYSVSADDFDHVFLAACQDALRSLVRSILADHVTDLTQADTTALQAAVAADVAPYGVEIHKVNITYAGPPSQFIQSLETRQLAIVQRREQAEKQALALQKLADDEVLARERVLAQVERERDLLRLQLQAAEMRKQLVELEAAAEELRLQKLQERLERFPVAARWEVESARMEIARALAGNTRAVVQVGEGLDVARAFLAADILHAGDGDRVDQN